MFQPARRSLAELLKEAPDKREYALDHLRRTISKQASKGLLTLSLAHRLAWEFMANADGVDIAHMVPTLQDGLPLMMSTKEGARCVNLCIAYSGAKVRARPALGALGLLLTPRRRTPAVGRPGAQEVRARHQGRRSRGGPPPLRPHGAGPTAGLHRRHRAPPQIYSR